MAFSIKRMAAWGLHVDYWVNFEKWSANKNTVCLLFVLQLPLPPSPAQRLYMHFRIMVSLHEPYAFRFNPNTVSVEQFCNTSILVFNARHLQMQLIMSERSCIGLKLWCGGGSGMDDEGWDIRVSRQGLRPHITRSWLPGSYEKINGHQRGQIQVQLIT